MNQGLRDKITRSNKYPYIEYTDLTELNALFGLLYNRGLSKLNFWSYRRIWDREKGHPILCKQVLIPDEKHCF